MNGFYLTEKKSGMRSTCMCVCVFVCLCVCVFVCVSAVIVATFLKLDTPNLACASKISRFRSIPSFIMFHALQHMLQHILDLRNPGSYSLARSVERRSRARPMLQRDCRLTRFESQLEHSIIQLSYERID